MTDPALAAAARAAIKVAKRRGRRLRELREALLKNDLERALMLARRLTGLEEENAESDRPASSLH